LHQRARQLIHEDECAALTDAMTQINPLLNSFNWLGSKASHFLHPAKEPRTDWITFANHFEAIKTKYSSQSGRGKIK